MSLLGGDGPEFDGAGTFVPEHLPAPGPTLDGYDVLAGEDHAAVHRESRDRFERFGVYDATFGYNLARLNLDPRHPDAGIRYGIDPADPGALRVAFTPTTAFCPQADTLARGIFRAWNGEDAAYDLVSVRVDPMHQHSGTTNERLAELEATYRETGEVAAEAAGTGLDGDGGAGPPSAPW